jgi:pimeloyl-[acyl-carrier protein] synthase
MSSTTAESFFAAAVSSEFQADPYPLYERMRVEAPVLELADGQWFVFGHEPVSRLLRHPMFSSDERRSNFYPVCQIDNPRWVKRAEAPNLLFMDPPDHTRLRRLVSRAFTSATVERARALTQQLVDQHLNEISTALKDGIEIDLVETFAHPIPVAVIGSILGVPTADLPMFKSWSGALARSVDPAFLRNETIDEAIDVAGVELRAYLDELADTRRFAPGDDLLSALLTVEEEGDRISRSELLELMQLLLIAGHETTVNLIGNAVMALTEHPDAQRMLVGDGTLIEGSIDEFMRYDSPVQLTQRIATVPLELLGAHIEPGDQVVLLLGSANRDPSVFMDPNELQLGRDAKRQVGFGGGIHLCLGASLARMEASVALSGLLDRFPNFALTCPPSFRAGFTLRGPAHLMIAAHA